MNRGTMCGLTAATLIGLLAGAAKADEGMVRISDSPPAGSKTETAPPPPGNGAPAAPANGLPASPEKGATAPGPNGEISAKAGTAACPPGAAAGGEVGRCRLCGALRSIIAYDPSRGFRPPQTVAVDREAIMYYHYWPAKLYGEPGWHLSPSFPQVYMPTDTTQLGVYYARVPQWMPDPRMYPRPPRPDEWGRRVVSADYAGGNCHGGPAAAGPTPAGPTPADKPVPDAVGSPVGPPPANGQPAMPPAPSLAPPPAPQAK